ncbi:hypothetical protein K432DRAFT_293758 [Lepidopterella palustris CBS 459.81]|uniref:DUF7820 domain-containing protein n=1 Tax=Lepidopterella palustris CBS 459.81 TaxID=1314670 RepID=A0A8E2EDV0_9PEZI|nr:hypothetical protein K432DRAFT_293758 [Lepidopterella palustris CBS 459.81]
MDRRQNDDDRTPRHSTNPNVFDDEYAIDPSDLDFNIGVVDGFRPSHDQTGPTRHDQGSDISRSRRSFSTTPATDLRRMASRNSTAKPPATRESFSILHDGHNGSTASRNPSIHARGASSQAPALVHRASVSSTASFATMARSENSYAGGPSHPYGMYPQNTTIARSASVTTSSTLRQPQRSLSMQRPSHPYGMYSQNGVESTDEEAIAPVRPVIPVGFPGLSSGYHRQIGPDGEEQDIIGPDGHTEQLPPYSRYPEEGPKSLLPSRASSTPIEVTPPGINTLHDIPTSPVTREERGVAGEERILPMTETSSNGEAEVTEKSRKSRSWKEIRSKRILWGKIPVWVLGLLIVLLLVFALILGAAIGTFAARERMQSHHKNAGQSVITITTTPSMFDATIIPTPSGLPPLPLGTFTLPIGTPQEEDSNCLTVSNQNSAWSCKMSGPPIKLSVFQTPGGGGLDASLDPMLGDDAVQYGVQTPTFDMQTLSLVLDQDYPHFGPAFHFQGMYNKVVVLENFAAGAGLRARDPGNNKDQDDDDDGSSSSSNHNFHHRSEVQPGDFPWYCYWNQTFIEGYLYVQDNSSAATDMGSSSTSGATTSPPSSPSSSSPTSKPDTSRASIISTSAFTYPTTYPSGSFSWPTTHPTSIPYVHRRDPRPPAYPRIVKIEERRLPGSPQPYCQKMQVLDNGNLVQAINSIGGAIIINLQETDPSLQQFSAQSAGPASMSGAAATSTSATNLKREISPRDDPQNACHCQWIWQ